MPQFNPEPEESGSNSNTVMTNTTDYDILKAQLLAEFKRREHGRLPGFTYFSPEEKLNKWDNTFGKCHFCWYAAKKHPMVVHVSTMHYTHWQDGNDVSEFIEILDAMKDDIPKYF